MSVQQVNLTLEVFGDLLVPASGQIVIRASEKLVLTGGRSRLASVVEIQFALVVDDDPLIQGSLVVYVVKPDGSLVALHHDNQLPEGGVLAEVETVDG